MSNGNGAVNAIQEISDTSNLRIEEAASFLTAGLDSLTPALVQRMVTTMAQMAELIDLINNDEMKNLLASAAQAAESLERSLGAIKAMEESGALESLVEMGEFANAMKQSLTSSLVVRSLSTGLSLAETGDQLLEAARESADEAKKDTRKLGPMALLNALKEPEMQESLKFLLAMARRIPGLLKTI